MGGWLVGWEVGWVGGWVGGKINSFNFTARVLTVNGDACNGTSDSMCNYLAMSWAFPLVNS